MSRQAAAVGEWIEVCETFTRTSEGVTMAADTPAGETAVRALSDDHDLSSLRVLHAEDQPGFAELTETGLARVDPEITVDHVETVAAAVERLAADRPAYDCVVSDYDLPDADGLSLLRTVRNRWPALPFLLFTGKGSESVAADAVAAGADDYLQKERGLGQFTVLAHRIGVAVRRARADRTLCRAVEAIEATGEGIGLVDCDGERSFFYCNSSYADILGYEPSTLVDSAWSRVHAAETVPEAVTETLSETDAWSGVTSFARADGTTVELPHRVERTDDGTLICTIPRADDAVGGEPSARTSERRAD